MSVKGQPESIRQGSTDAEQPHNKFFQPGMDLAADAGERLCSGISVQLGEGLAGGF